MPSLGTAMIARAGKRRGDGGKVRNRGGGQGRGVESGPERDGFVREKQPKPPKHRRLWLGYNNLSVWLVDLGFKHTLANDVASSPPVLPYRKKRDRRSVSTELVFFKSK